MSGILPYVQYVQFIPPCKNLEIDENVSSNKFVWKRYHWIGIGKDINRYRFRFLNFHLEFLKNFWAVKNASNLLILRQVLYRILSSFLFAGTLLFDAKSAKVLHYFGLDCGLLWIYNPPAEEVRWLDGFWTFIQNSRWKFKNTLINWTSFFSLKRQ